MNKLTLVLMGIGDWGLGIAQSPIPNPQSPSPKVILPYNYNAKKLIMKHKKYICSKHIILSFNLNYYKLL